MKTHKFDVKDAKKYGVKKAIILEHLRFHQQANQGNKKLEFNDKTWAFLKKETIEKMYPYFSYSSVKRWLKELENDGIVKSCKPKSNWGNHLVYYHVKQKSNTNSQNENSGSQNESSPNSQNENSSIITNMDNTNGKKINKKPSQSSKKPSTQERTKKYIPLAKYLSKVVRSHINYDIDHSRIKKWAKDLRLLHEQNGVHPKRQKKVLKWYRKNIGGEFIPEAFSGSSFRDKFPKLLAAMKRQKKKPKSSNNEAGHYESEYEHRTDGQI